MTNSELARRMMRLAIADSGLSTTEFLIKYRINPIAPEYAEQLKARALASSE